LCAFSIGGSDQGRFRAFVKTVLSAWSPCTIEKASERVLARIPSLNPDSVEDVSSEDENFLITWRDDLLSQTWQALADFEAADGIPYNTLLRLRVAEPELTSEELADRIGQTLGKPTTAGAPGSPSTGPEKNLPI
jgi:hypothetical protein